MGNVDLYHCDNSGCQYNGSTSVDAGGNFVFTNSPFTGFLVPGQYKLIARADQYDQTETDIFEARADEDHNVGDVALQPFPIRISLVRPCADIPASGGSCLYTVQITNRRAERISGRVWSIVTGFGLGSHAGVTVFQAGGQSLSLESLSSKATSFAFQVPGDVSANATICVASWFGEEHRAAYFKTLAQADLFCVNKMASGNFRTLSKKESLKLFRELDSPQKAIPNQK
ncbi:MAG TPA: carboxypeptidase-like regulatory domain-containing protein, partial [Burkholderiales bacterium]|nr:carboxypeptidase-like regulatory domain-containing protein [Burkholderiales bacterium]